MTIVVPFDNTLLHLKKKMSETFDVSILKLSKILNSKTYLVSFC